MVKFAVEDFNQIASELAPLFGQHWREAGLDQDSIKLAPDWERYALNQNQGLLHVVTVRSEGKLVGYYMAFILPHMHYREAGPMGYPDAYFILPEYRKGGAGAKLFAEMERTLWERGCSKIYTSTKVHLDRGEMLERMGYNLTDKVYTKLRPRTKP